MIRKIFFFVLLVYTTIWFSVAYTVKNKIVDIINNSETDNIKLSYSQIKVSGFPTQMKIGLIEPKIKFIDRINSREVSVDQLELLIALNFKNMHLIIGNNIKQQDNFGDKSVEYNIKPKESIIGLIKFDKTLYQLSNRDTLKSVINSLEFSNGSILVTHQDKELFNLTDLAFLINKVKSPDIEDITLQLRLLYSSEENYLSFKKAKLDLSTIITIVIDKTKNTESIKNLVIDRLIFVCDDDAQVDLFGSLGFSDDKLPRGKLSFELINYHNVIDKLIPSNLLLPKRMIKNVVEKAVNSSSPPAVKADDNELSTYEKIKFDVEFSDNGINIGSVNLLEFKAENNDKSDIDRQEESLSHPE